MKRFFSFFVDTWIGAFTLMFSIYFFIVQHFIVPSQSMENTMKVGDFFLVKKFSYGVPIPRIPFMEIPLFPDINGNGHLIKGDGAKKGEIVVFRFPKNDRQYYVKRCVATEGDEVIYYDNHLLIHSNDKEFMKGKKIVSFNGKDWADNPYSKKGAIYKENKAKISSFSQLLDKKDIDMIKKNDNKIGTYFYKKIDKDKYYMIGDNRNDSFDSRYWGEVEYKHLVGKAFLHLFGLSKNSKHLSFIE